MQRPGPYRWFGGDPGDALPDIGDARAKHSKGNKDGTRLVRPELRLVPKAKFKTITGIADLADQLFGPVRSDIAILLNQQLRANAGCHKRTVIERLCPRDFSWEGSMSLAYMVAGNALIAQSGGGDPHKWEGAVLEAAQKEGRWRGTLPELWATLYLEHRRWYFSSPYEAGSEQTALLDTLCHAYVSATADSRCPTNKSIVLVQIPSPQGTIPKVLIFYRVIDQNVEIICVFHAAQDRLMAHDLR